MLGFSPLLNVKAYNLGFSDLKFSISDISIWKFRLRTILEAVNLGNVSHLVN